MRRVPIPPKKKGGSNIDRFISGAGRTKQGYPWESANERVIKGFGLRLTEVELMKLKFIAENTPYSVHSFIMDIVRPAIDLEIERLTGVE